MLWLNGALVSLRLKIIAEKTVSRLLMVSVCFFVRLSGLVGVFFKVRPVSNLVLIGQSLNGNDVDSFAPATFDLYSIFRYLAEKVSAFAPLVSEADGFRLRRPVFVHLP